MPTIGLTGNFGMGKSTVLELFRELGAHTLSSDDLVHEALERPEIIRRISKALGPGVAVRRRGRSAIDKRVMADVIFADPLKRRAAEKIIHPEVIRFVQERLSAISDQDPSAVIVVEVPLLFEGGYERHFDRSVVVTCRKDTAWKRLSRKGVSKDEAIRRMKAQMALSEKRKRADFLIDNSGSLDRTRLQVEMIYRSLTER